MMRNRREKTLLNSYQRFLVNVFLNWVEKKWKTFKTSSKQMEQLKEIKFL